MITVDGQEVEGHAGDTADLDEVIYVCVPVDLDDIDVKVLSDISGISSGLSMSNGCIIAPPGTDPQVILDAIENMPEVVPLTPLEKLLEASHLTREDLVEALQELNE